MFAQLKSELRKLLTIRSTYILISLALLLIALFAYTGTSVRTYEEAVCAKTGEVLYTEGRADPRLDQAPAEEICGGTVNYNKITSRDLPKEKLLYNLQEALPVVVTFVSIVLILLIAHEYRYNIINHTLTISNRRSKVLLAKVILSTIVTVLVALMAMAVSVAATYAAVGIKDLTLPAQDYNWLYIMARHIGYAVGYALFCVGIAALVRNLTAGIAAAFLLPTLDSIGGFLLSARNIQPTKILPFSALDRFGNVASDITASTVDIAEKLPGAASGQPATVLMALAVFGAYLIGLWLVTWILFLKRDAN